MIEEDLLADLDYLESCLDETRNAILKVIELANAKLDAVEVDRLRAKKKQIYEDLQDSVESEWVGLTHDEILDSLAPSYEYVEKEFFSIVRSLEAKLKEKNT